MQSQQRSSAVCSWEKFAVLTRKMSVLIQMTCVNSQKRHQTTCIIFHWESDAAVDTSLGFWTVDRRPPPVGWCQWGKKCDFNMDESCWYISPLQLLQVAFLWPNLPRLPYLNQQITFCQNWKIKSPKVLKMWIVFNWTERADRRAILPRSEAPEELRNVLCDRVILFQKANN